VRKESILRYLVLLFSALSYDDKSGKADIDTILDDGKDYVRELEDNLAEKILQPDGVFVGLVKGILDHDLKKQFSNQDLAAAKETALKVLYRMWFLLYAESRNLLPVKHDKYRATSLITLRSQFDALAGRPDGTECWEYILQLFKFVREGSLEYSVPQYNGDLFRFASEIDNAKIKNKFAVRFVQGLIERDGDPVDYATLGVRHLGNIYETLLEFEVRQAKKDLLLREDDKGAHEVTATIEATYSFKKHDLYLISKRGALSKQFASYYTPEEIVIFLVMQGLDPILNKREKQIPQDIKKYTSRTTEKNRQTCIDRILDIQVLDPAMGSGHFLVEALNRITEWATKILEKYPEHPLNRDIERDRQTIIASQKVPIEEQHLTYNVLLKRRVLKRCIFGVDVNPFAAELAKISLWLDTFTVGVPLSFMNHHIKTGDATIGIFYDDLEDVGSHTMDIWVSGKPEQAIHNVANRSDLTIDQVHASEDEYRKHAELLEPTRQIFDAHAASIIDPKILPKKKQAEFIRRFGTDAPDLDKLRTRVNELADMHSFFHWELEMTDAFTDSKRGFDLIVGNPPWEKIKPNNDEFFTPHDPPFKSLSPNTKKKARMKQLLKNQELNQEYQSYTSKRKEMSDFYSIMCELQGAGDKDLYLLVLERVLKLAAKDGIISMVVPSQILSNRGPYKIRKHLLERDILQIYVFENRKKIFPIDSRYRFALITVQNKKTAKDKFPVGFYLHQLSSLVDRVAEAGKFGNMSKKIIYSISDTYTIPEIANDNLKILLHMFENRGSLGSRWDIKLGREFDNTNDSNLFLENGKGWPIFEGKYMHQYNHKWNPTEFTADPKKGLDRLSKKRVFCGQHAKVHNSYQLIFRNTSSPTNMRTIISTIIPPHAFYADSVRSIVLYYNNDIKLDRNYYNKIAYLCGIFNSLTFDFISRAFVQIAVAPILRSFPLPSDTHESQIAKLVAKLVCGTSEFAEFADIMRVKNRTLGPRERIEAVAEIDALVAHSYKLSLDQYRTILDTFKFSENSALLEVKSADFNDNTVLREFYGEVRKLVPEYYKEIAAGGGRQ